MDCFRQYRVIDAMELRVVNQTRDTGESITVSGNASTSAASVLGAACQEFKIPLDPTLGIYTQDSIMLSDKKSIASYGLRTGDTVYLRAKVEGDEILFLLNWRVVATFLILLAFVGLFVAVVIFVTTSGITPFVYGVVIDAGSSHSEATLYYWDGSKFYGTGKVIQLASEEIKTFGIADLEPRKVQKILGNLLEKIKKLIPVPEVSRTKVYLGATAGMRLLNISDPARADLNLFATENAIMASGMAFGKATILSGEDEGLSAWLSTNYLLDRLPRDDSSPQDLVAAMDCGGASAQIAFEVNREKNHPEFHLMKLYRHEYNVFSRSYLCFGANEAFKRYVMLLLSEQEYDTREPIESPCHNVGYNSSIELGTIVTPCTFHSGLPEHILKQEKNSTLRIIGIGEGRICRVTVANLFPEKGCHARGFAECFKKMPISLPDVKFVAMSSFAYAMNDLNFQGGTTTELEQLIDSFCVENYSSLKARLYDNKDKYAAVACFNAAFTYNLLLNFGVSNVNLRRMTFTNKVKEYNLGWSLGYMINATNAIPAADSYPALLPLPWFVILAVLFSSLLVAGFFAYIVSSRRERRIVHSNKQKLKSHRALELKETAA